ncbi:MAG: S-layer homology domain-containing protein [Chthonomonadales bacterium]|nr:S-layer homology domain-containing protein [Chthonomonadales bacterium]
MRKVLTFLGASVCLAWVLPVMAQVAPPEFSDVPTDHWAYEAVESLRAKNILVGYPDGYFRGKRTLSRYEFAVALKRALESIQLVQGAKGDSGPQGPKGDPGEAGAPGPQGPAGVGPEELATLKKLADEFKAELANQGVNINALNAKLDKVAKDVADLRATVEGMPKISGTVFAGIRVDRSTGAFVDMDGRPSNPILSDTAVMTHALELGVAAKSGSTDINGSIVVDNYKNYLGGSYIGNFPLMDAPVTDVYLNKLTVKAPFSGFGQNGALTIGRVPFKLSPLTLWRPDTDRYFNNPIFDDGAYRMDGLTLDSGVGSLGLTVFAGSFKTVNGNMGTWMGPVAGVSSPMIYAGMGVKPVGVAGDDPLFLEQIGGLSATLPLRVGQEGSQIRATAMLGTGTVAYPAMTPFTNVAVLGADAKLNLSDNVTFDASWSKSLTGIVRNVGSVNAGQNDAYVGNLGLRSGSLGVTAGYKYIDPMFYAPGFWGRIGNWLNPTNIQGPTLALNYDFSPAFAMNAGYDFYTEARNRAAAGSLGKDDEIHRVLVGLRWALSDSFETTVDWEGVYWRLLSGSTGRVHPQEHYFTIGTGYALNDTTKIKLGYQIGSFDGHGFLTGGAGSGGNFNYNVFTTQVSVRF